MRRTPKIVLFAIVALAALTGCSAATPASVVTVYEPGPTVTVTATPTTEVATITPSSHFTHMSGANMYVYCGGRFTEYSLDVGYTGPFTIGTASVKLTQEVDSGGRQVSVHYTTSTDAKIPALILSTSSVISGARVAKDIYVTIIEAGAIDQTFITSEYVTPGLNARIYSVRACVPN